MDLLTVVLAVEHDSSEYSAQEIVDAIREHKEKLRSLQGFWTRLIKAMEDLGEI